MKHIKKFEDVDTVLNQGIKSRSYDLSDISNEFDSCEDKSTFEELTIRLRTLKDSDPSIIKLPEYREVIKKWHDCLKTFD